MTGPDGGNAELLWFTLDELTVTFSGWSFHCLAKVKVLPVYLYRYPILGFPAVRNALSVHPRSRWQDLID